MSFKVGRLSMSRDPRNVDQSGDLLTLVFDIVGATFDKAQAHRQMVLGLADNSDEPVVPVTLSLDADLDGYYRVVSADATPVRTYLSNFLIRCQVQMRRVGGYYKPLIELHASCAQINNAHTLTTYGRIAHPQDDIEDYNAGTGFGEYDSVREAAVDGGRIRWTRVPNLPATGVVSYYVPPANFYIGASTLEVVRDSVWYPVHGRQVPKLETVGGWRLTNGLVRISPSGSHFYLLEVYDGGWVDLATLERGYDDSGWNALDFGVNDPTGLSWTGESVVKVDPVLMRNSPERVTVRIPQWGGYEDLSLMRGAGWVELTYARPGESPGEKFGIGTSTAIAVTDNTNRATRTSADGNGNKFFMAIPAANTVSGGRIWQDVADPACRTLVGVETPQFDSGTAEYLYAYTGVGVTQRIVPR